MRSAEHEESRPMQGPRKTETTKSRNRSKEGNLSSKYFDISVFRVKKSFDARDY
jgi:hypothetical protein